MAQTIKEGEEYLKKAGEEESDGEELIDMKKRSKRSGSKKKSASKGKRSSSKKGRKSGSKSPKPIHRAGTMAVTAEEGAEYLKKEGFESGKRRRGKADDDEDVKGKKTSGKKVKK